jgi:predicted RNase H-like HicB family nuclease
MSDNNYEIVIYWSDEDDVFVAEVPELPGCAAHGDSREETLRQAQQAIDNWLHAAREIGHRIPTPKGRLAFS